MKSATRFIAKLLVMLAFWSATPVVLAKPGVVIVRSGQGEATSSSNGVEMERTRVGMQLGPGCTFKTGPYGRLDLYMNGTLVRMRPNTEIQIEQLDYQDTGKDLVIKTKIRLIKGAVRGVVGKLGQLSSYTVLFPGGEMRNSGGEFETCSTGEATAVTGKLLIIFNQTEHASAKASELFGGYSASRDGVRKLNPAESADQALLTPELIGCIGFPPEPAMPLFPEPNFPRRKGL